MHRLVLRVGRRLTHPNNLKATPKLVPRSVRNLSLRSFMSKRKLEESSSGDTPEPPGPAGAPKMAMAPSTTTIELTQSEAQLKALLLDVAKYIDESKPGDEPVVLRWAGGWVRDKLLGIESHDIDTAINVMTGEAFSRKIGEFCKNEEAVHKHGLSEKDVGSVHVIAANPEKSKHLETATLRLLGYDVDFVNLRKEVYAEDSRNPQMEFGTAEEDAMRRDATINALFYNLNTSEVEDFTGGLADLQAKLIKTPMDPFKTLTDDPLRVLRLVRFASRLEFTIDPAVEKLAGDPRVLDALRLKITRARIGTEVTKMLRGNHPKRALELIDTLGLYHTVFTDPTKPNAPKPDLHRWRLSYECLDRLEKNKTPGSIYDLLVRADRTPSMAWALAAICPWAQVKQTPNFVSKAAYRDWPTIAAREGIVAPNTLCDLIKGAVQHRAEITALKSAVCERRAHEHGRDRFGMAIQKWEGRGGHWRQQVLFALLFEAMEVLESTEDKAMDGFLAGWQMLVDHLQELDIMDAPSLPRIIDGNGLAKALGVGPGKWLKDGLNVCLAWQFRNPGVDDPTGAIEEVRSKAKELGVPGHLD